MKLRHLSSAICPYCGHEHKDSIELLEGSTRFTTCRHCENVFLIEEEVIYVTKQVVMNYCTKCGRKTAIIPHTTICESCWKSDFRCLIEGICEGENNDE